MAEKEHREVFDPFLSETVAVSDDLCDRLRGRYACGPTMANGEPEFGWREFETRPIQHEAAALIEALKASVASLEAELAKRPDWETVNITYEKWKTRAEAAEAERDELKASFEARIQQMSENFRAVNIARVIEATGVDLFALQERTLAAEAQLAKEKAENERINAARVSAWVVNDDDGTISALMVWSTRDDAQAAADALGMDDSHVVPVEIRALKPQPETDGRV